MAVQGFTRALVVALVALAACGGSDDDTASDTATSDTADADVATAAPATLDDAAAGSPPTAPPAETPAEPAEPDEPGEPTGTITTGSETWDVAGLAPAGGDFLICEGDNPAFPGDANIIIRLDADREFSFLVSDGVPSAGFGDSLFGEDASEVSFERDGGTIVGQASYPDAGTVDFTITCS